VFLTDITPIPAERDVDLTARGYPHAASVGLDSLRANFLGGWIGRLEDDAVD